jgi:periplasmic divalent cation tolerance protein
MTGVLQVSTVAGSQMVAERLLRSAVQGRFAAGGRVTGPAQSAFWHDGVFGTGEEWVAVLFTTAERYAELAAHLLAEHEWANPEITAVRVEAGSPPFLDWVRRTASAAAPAVGQCR